jgi:hypothetical protein
LNSLCWRLNVRRYDLGVIFVQGELRWRLLVDHFVDYCCPKLCFSNRQISTQPTIESLMKGAVVVVTGGTWIHWFSKAM